MPHDARRTARRIHHPPHREAGREAFPLRHVAQAMSIAVCGIALQAALAQPVLAQAASALAQPPAARQAYGIPAGALAPALRSLASTANLLLTFTEEQTRGKTTAGVSGQHTPQGALAAVLAGTGLQAVQLDNGAYVLRAAPAPAPAASTPPPAAGDAAALAAVTVTAAAVRAGDLPEAYAGGQVARGGRLGLLGNVDVMDTPFNITHYTAKLIEDQQASTVGDVLQNEPSVRQASSLGRSSEVFYIRGFMVNTSDVTFDGLSGMVPTNGRLPTEFAERVEVLKGASALLYGMPPGGAVGGAINLVPKRAGDEPLTRLTLGVESDALWKGHVDTGRRFGANNQWGLRFNGSLNKGDGFIDDQKKSGHLGALALDYRGERLRATLDAYRVREKQEGAAALGISVDSSLQGTMPAAPSGRTNILPGSPGGVGTTEAVILGGEYDFNDRWTGYAKLGRQRNEFEGQFAAGNVLNLQANGDGFISASTWPSFFKTVSAEAGLRGRFQTGTVSHALALSASRLSRDSGGVYPSGTSQPTNIYAPAPILSWPVTPTQVPKTSEITFGGLALADTLGFMDDRVLLTLGVRRQDVKTTNFNASSGAVASRYDKSAWTPMAGLVVKPTDDLSLYANVIQGLSQGTTVGDAYLNAGQAFPPYKTKQIELGAKLQTGRFTNTITVFQMEKPSTTSDNSTTPLPTLRLDGEQRNRGIEWTFFGEPARGLRMLGGVTYTQSRLTRTQGGLQDGNHAPGSPPWAANLGADWDVPGLPGLALSGRITHTSRQYINNANTLKLPSWTRLDLGARYTTQVGDKPVVFRANVDNVFDKNHWQGVWASGGPILGTPRVFRLSATLDF